MIDQNSVNNRFPKESEFKEKWITLTKRENWFPSNYSVVCSCHFTDDCFIMMKNRRRLLDTAVPTLSLPITADADTSESRTSNSIESNPDPLSLSPPSSPKTSKIKINTFQPEMPLQIDSPVQKQLNQCILELSDTPATPKNSQEKLGTVQLDMTVHSPVKQTLSSQIDTIAENQLSQEVIELSHKMARKSRQLKKLQDQVRYYKKLFSMGYSKRTRRDESDKLE